LKGLSSWRQQLIGNADLELAKAVLINVYELKFSVQMLRQQVKSFPAEPELRPEELKALDSGRGLGELKPRSTSVCGIQFQKEYRGLTANVWEAQAIWLTDDVGKTIATKGTGIRATDQSSLLGASGDDAAQES